MKIWSMMGNSQKLDGGAMFGNAPKALWTRWASPDEHNRIPLACRCLLIREPTGRLILCEAGIGAFFPPKLRTRFGVQESEHILLQSLEAIGIAPEEIDVISLSHLHFDHAGGVLTRWSERDPLALCFPNASYVVGEAAWARALSPHYRDRASFIPELVPLLEETGRLEIVPSGQESQTLGEGYTLLESHGHTPGQLHLLIPSAEGPVLFCGDLIPGVPWVHLPITMGYDRYPELLIEEKGSILNQLLPERARLFFTHDPSTALARFDIDERGRFHATERWSSLAALTI